MFETTIKVHGIMSFLMGYIEIMYNNEFPSLSHLLFGFYEDTST